ncbi:coiled-coil domain-containing protein mad1 [Knufia obscura]|uniref:Spindle assembly checkpoint component MAD1 n=1 Tax=Knufia obscura TaxID=1635080 RepID=A0ABR0RIY0_9EURO|nr:coiled-coil domain-containing protein mad1 [Knufia obscura]
MASPAKRMRMSSQRASLSGSSLRQSVSVTTPSQNALRASTNAANRAGTAQPTSYDIISGQPIELAPEKARRRSFSHSQGPGQSLHASQSLRKSTSRQSLLPQPHSQPQQSVQAVNQQKHQDEKLELQARINKLEYENRNLEAERGMISLQHEKELREAQARADADYKRYQDAESERLKAVRQHENAMKEIRDIRDRGANDSAVVERRSRDLQVQCDQLREDKEDLEARLSDAEREMRRIQVEDVEGARSRLERTMQETAAELEEMKARFETVNDKLREKEKYAEELEGKVLDLNGRTGGGEELEVLKREFSEQMANVRRLENIERDQRTKIRRLEDERRSVNVVMEEKRALETRIRVLQDCERRAAEMEMQKELLEDEKRTWTSLLEREGDEDQPAFESPEAVVKALVNERIEHAQVLERVGEVESELIGKDEALKAVESERNVLRMELEKAKENATMQETQAPEPESKAIKRLERQSELAKKEIEYLRAQLDTFNSEELTMMDNQNFDTQRAEQIQRLENLVTEYKSEIQTLHTQISSLESAPPAPEPQPIQTPQLAGQKRPAESQDPDNNEELGRLLRKNKNLQTALEKSKRDSAMLATQLQATRSQLKALRSSTSYRILELRENPTATHQAIQASTLRTLQQENRDLMVQLRGNQDEMSRVKVVPVSSLDALKLDLSDMERQLESKDKRMRRQREIWTDKAAEFRDVISSILGYKVTFLPNGKVRVRSMYYNPARSGNGDGEGGEEVEVDEDDREDYIEFDGEKGTMKIGGGRDGAFGKAIEGQVSYWVGEKKEIPCFLAAMTLEFYEEFGGMAEGRGEGG